VIRAEGLVPRGLRMRIAPLTLALGAGVHALLGGPEDGVRVVLALFAGRLRAKAGSLRVLGKPIEDARTCIGYVPLDVALPDAFRVDEALDCAAAIRGEHAPAAAERLAALGVQPLAQRPVRTLTLAEARAVAIAEAVTSNADVLLIEEPFVSLDPRATGPLAKRLRARAAEGACVVVSTASPRDAAELADTQIVFDRGIVLRATANEVRTARSVRGARLSIGVTDRSAVLAALAAEGCIRGIESDRAAIVVVGDDVTQLAGAVARAVVASGADLEWMRPEAPSLEELRGTAAGDARAAYDAAVANPRSASGAVS
jgi:ABC-type multidrug transport system ATPase subunit